MTIRICCIHEMFDGDAMRNFVGPHFKPGPLKRGRSSDALHLVLAVSLQSTLFDSGVLLPALPGRRKQERKRHGEAYGQSIHAAMNRLAELFAPDDSCEIMSAADDPWALEIGLGDCRAAGAKIRRRDTRAAAFLVRNDSGTRAAGGRPLGPSGATHLIGSGQAPAAEHGVCRPDSRREHVLDCSTGDSDRSEPARPWPFEGLKPQLGHWGPFERVRMAAAGWAVHGN